MRSGWHSFPLGVDHVLRRATVIFASSTLMRQVPERNSFGGHDDSFLYLVQRLGVTPKASPICCHDQPFSRADVTWFAEDHGYGAVTKASRRARVSSMSRRVFFE